MRVIDSFNGYKDPEVFGVVVVFEHEGKEYGAYCDFHRRAPLGEILGISDHSTDNEIPADESNPLWASAVTNPILEAAREYIRGYYARCGAGQPGPEPRRAPEPADPEPTREQSLRAKLQSIQ